MRRETRAHRTGFVAAEIDALGGAQHGENLAEGMALIERLFRQRGAVEVRMAAQPDKLGGDAFGRQHRIHAPGGDGAARHAIRQFRRLP